MTADPTLKLSRIISGGQTGVDRAALDVAMELGIPCGGWCPLGRLAEDGRIPECYPLTEHQGGYAARTRRNVEEADATLILTHYPLTGGTNLTSDLCKKLDRRYAVVNLRAEPWEWRATIWEHREALREKLAPGGPMPWVLNVAGPRESKFPGIYAETRAWLLAVLLPGITAKEIET